MNAFLTGSHAYGSPSDDSDVDLVVRCDEETRAKLVELFAPPEVAQYGASVQQFKVGKLNLILCTSDERFRAWSQGTEFLREVAPVERSKAVRVFKALFGVLPQETP